MLYNAWSSFLELGQAHYKYSFLLVILWCGNVSRAPSNCSLFCRCRWKRPSGCTATTEGQSTPWPSLHRLQPLPRPRLLRLQGTFLPPHQGFQLRITRQRQPTARHWRRLGSIPRICFCSPTHKTVVHRTVYFAWFKNPSAIFPLAWRPFEVLNGWCVRVFWTIALVTRGGGGFGRRKTPCTDWGAQLQVNGWTENWHCRRNISAQRIWLYDFNILAPQTKKKKKKKKEKKREKKQLDLWFVRRLW